MTAPAPVSRFRALATVAFFMACGLAGSFVGRLYVNALGTTPAWVGPAILIGSLACFVAGLLLLPTAIQSFRAAKAPKTQEHSA